MSEPATHATVEAVMRRDYGRLIAYLSARSGDVAGAEDALGEAFASAMKRWPEDGIPGKPEAWLLHVARNKMIDTVRHRQVREQAVERLMVSDEFRNQEASEPEPIPDDRLKLLFVCAHPAIDPAARTPLMLQTVLGVDAARIASAFLVSPAAMSQRLVRVKNKIREAAIPFRVPEPAEWDERLSFVLDAIYAAYTTGWESVAETGTTHHALAGEAISLGRTLLTLMPDEPEALGLLSLMLHCEARRDARLSDKGDFIPLDQQDPARWSRSMITEAEDSLRTASTAGNIGRYQLEAAIQSIHANRARTGIIDWPEILLLYEGLVQFSPGIGPLVGRAVAMAESGHAEAALDSLGRLPPARTASYQPYWAARGHLLFLLDRKEEAKDALTRAASLTDDPALRAHLLKRAAELP
jgi:RNA polymerase sigma-70 factor (ECF subfamily)